MILKDGFESWLNIEMYLRLYQIEIVISKSLQCLYFLFIISIHILNETSHVAITVRKISRSRLKALQWLSNIICKRNWLRQILRCQTFLDTSCGRKNNYDDRKFSTFMFYATFFWRYHMFWKLKLILNSVSSNRYFYH